jgi:YHS domain-containing protein
VPAATASQFVNFLPVPSTSPPSCSDHARLHRPPRRRLLRRARRGDRLIAAAPVEEDGDPPANAMLAQAHREALVRQADDDEADPRSRIEPVAHEPQLGRVVSHEHGRRAPVPRVTGCGAWGDVVYQEGGYIGGSLNIASRVAGEAKPHQILVSAAVRGEVGGLPGVRFTPLGQRQLKGLVDELEVFEVRAGDAPAGERARDPVCGMGMAPTEVAARLAVDGREVAFCCEKCLKIYLGTPQRYRA